MDHEERYSPWRDLVGQKPEGKEARGDVWGDAWGDAQGEAWASTYMADVESRSTKGHL